MKGTPIVIHGHGKQTRDFVYVKDVIRAIKKALYSKEQLNSEFEVGTGRETSINDLADMIFRISGKTVSIEHAPLPYAQLDSVRCSEPLFVEKPVPLEDGLKLLLKARSMHNSSS